MPFVAMHQPRATDGTTPVWIAAESGHHAVLAALLVLGSCCFCFCGGGVVFFVLAVVFCSFVALIGTGDRV
jgi:hypothetical protein